MIDFDVLTNLEAGKYFRRNSQTRCAYVKKKEYYQLSRRSNIIAAFLNVSVIILNIEFSEKLEIINVH